MQVAELFVTLGIKGADKTVGTLKDTNKGLKEIASSGLAVKAALVGAFYALERLFAASGKAGAGLANFSAATGISADTLQRYQYAARQVNVSNEEVEGSFRALQKTMTQTLMGEQAPKGLARLAQLTGNIDTRDIDAFAKNPALLLQRLQEYAAKETNAGFRNEVLKSFGLGDAMTAALSRGAFKPDILAKAPTYSENTINALDKVNAAWANLSNQIEMSIGGFNARYGGQIVSGVSQIVTEVFRLVGALTQLAEKLHVFDGIKFVVAKTADAIGGIAKGVDVGAGALTDPKKADALKQSVSDFFTTTVPDKNNLTGALHEVTELVNGLANAFHRLSKETEVFEEIGDIFESWAVIFEGITTLVKTVTDLATNPKAAGALGTVADVAGKVADFTGASMLKDLFTGKLLGGAMDFIMDKTKTGTDEGKRRRRDRKKSMMTVPEGPQAVMDAAKAGADAVKEGAGKVLPVAPPNEAPAPYMPYTPLRPTGPVGPMPSEAPTGKQGAFLRLVPNMPSLPDSAPRLPSEAATASNMKTINVDVRQTLEFSGAAGDPNQLAAAQKRAVKDAWNTMAARTGGV